MSGHSGRRSAMLAAVAASAIGVACGGNASISGATSGLALSGDVTLSIPSSPTDRCVLGSNQEPNDPVRSLSFGSQVVGGYYVIFKLHPVADVGAYSALAPLRSPGQGTVVEVMYQPNGPASTTGWTASTAQVVVTTLSSTSANGTLSADLVSQLTQEAHPPALVTLHIEGTWRCHVVGSVFDTLPPAVGADHIGHVQLLR